VVEQHTAPTQEALAHGVAHRESQRLFAVQTIGATVSWRFFP
jgi:hypothetical protein